MCVCVCVCVCVFSVFTCLFFLSFLLLFLYLVSFYSSHRASLPCVPCSVPLSVLNLHYSCHSNLCYYWLFLLSFPPSLPSFIPFSSCLFTSSFLLPTLSYSLFCFSPPLFHLFSFLLFSCSLSSSFPLFNSNLLYFCSYFVSIIPIMCLHFSPLFHFILICNSTLYFRLSLSLSLYLSIYLSIYLSLALSFPSIFTLMYLFPFLHSFFPSYFTLYPNVCTFHHLSSSSYFRPSLLPLPPSLPVCLAYLAAPGMHNTGNYAPAHQSKSPVNFNVPLGVPGIPREISLVSPFLYIYFFSIYTYCSLLEKEMKVHGWFDFVSSNSLYCIVTV